MSGEVRFIAIVKRTLFNSVTDGFKRLTNWQSKTTKCQHLT